MYSGGKIENTDQLQAARDRQIDASKRAAEADEKERAARQELQEASYDRSEAGNREARARQDMRQDESDMRGETKSVQNAEDALANVQHQLKESRAQLDQQWREWQSSKQLADTMQANFSRKLFSWISEKVAAFFDEYRQRMGEIERAMLALFQKMSVAANPEIEKTPPSGSTQLSFATYVMLSDVPQNDAISQAERVKAELDQLIERGKTLAEREADPFYQNKLNEAVARLTQAKSMLSQAVDTLKVAEKAKKVAEKNQESAVKVYEDDSREAQDRRLEAQEIGNEIAQYGSEQEAERLKQAKKQDAQRAARPNPPPAPNP